MSEADTPNNALPGADQANPSSNSPDEKSASGTVPVSEEVNRQSLDFQAFSSWVEAAETRTVSALPVAETGIAAALPRDETGNLSAVSTDQASVASSELTQMVALTQELHSTNSQLLKRVDQLEQKLAESQKILQQHRKRSQAQEGMFNEKQHELTEAQEQTRRLFYELEAAHQTTQRQQILIETLTDQLESSQERVAQLERECASTRSVHNQQSYQLVETENTCRELRSRLSRQQRHTLQFKVALDKCLEMPTPCQLQTDTISLENVTTPVWDRETSESPSFVSKAQPIPPWSAQADSSLKDSAWDSLSPASTSNTWGDESIAPVAAVEVEATNVPTAVIYPIDAFGQQFSQAVSTPKGTFEEQLDALMNLLFQASSTPSTESPPEITPTEPHLNENTSEAGAHWQDLTQDLTRSLPDGTVTFTSSDSVIAPAPSSTPLNPPLNPEQGEPLNYPYQSNYDHEDWYPNVLEEIDNRGLLPLLDRQQSLLLPMDNAGSNQGDDFTQTSSPATPSSKTNSPAPIVYPLRPPKGRKSLAAVELPSFPLPH